MMQRILAVFVLGILVVYAGSAMAQTPAPRPAAPPEQPSAVPAPPAEVALPEAAQQPPTQPTHAPMPMKQRMPEGMMPPPALGKWWKDSQIVNELQLTPEQINQLEKAFINHRLKLIDLQAALQVGELKLEALLEEDRPAEPQVIAQIDQVTQARGNLEKENAMMMLGVRRVLSVEQWKKLQEIQHQHMGPMRMKQPPGPMEGMPRKRVPAGEFPSTRPAPTAPRPPGE